MFSVAPRPPLPRGGLPFFAPPPPFLPHAASKDIMVVGHSVSVLVKEAAIGSALGLVAAFGWLFTITMPVQARITDYYAKHPPA